MPKKRSVALGDFHKMHLGDSGTGKELSRYRYSNISGPSGGYPKESSFLEQRRACQTMRYPSSFFLDNEEGVIYE